MNNSTDAPKMKVCGACKKEFPATSDFFYLNKLRGQVILYSVCKQCKKRKMNPSPKTNDNKIIKCGYCGIEKTVNYRRKKFCSHRCASYSSRDKLRKLATSQKPQRSSKPKTTRAQGKCKNCGGTCRKRQKFCNECKSIFITKNCKRCGIDFKSKIYQLDEKYCSDKCRNSDEVRRKKIYDPLTSGYVTRNDIFRMENYTCKSCGCKTKKKFTYIKGTQIPKHDSPTIDHIIPLSLGGEHMLSNVQLLCYRCNTSKQDSFLDEGEQLKMF